MPINYKEYAPNWKLISRFIRYYRAKNQCEWCGVKNHAVGYRVDGKFIEYSYAMDILERTGEDLYEGIDTYKKPTKIVLTVAHLDHNRDNNSFFNLAALCQKCHLHHDRHQHAQSRKYGQSKNQLTLFQ